jgi:class 3 adenylate cyclase/pimeloyl-ACP methyl ester carboxylesterase
VEQPEVRYARSGDVAIAYYVVGDGPRDLVFAPLTLSMVFAWHLPVVREFCLRLASFSRLILFDRRGIGASDRPRTPPTLESQMEDVRAVLDAVGSEQAALFGSGHGGQMCALFAASYPERTTALVLYATRARVPGTPDEHRAMLRRIRDEFGTKEDIERGMLAYPTLAQDAEFARWMPVIVRASVSPGGAAEFLRTYFEADISEVLPTIRVPTLVLYRPDVIQPEPGRMPVVEESRELAEAIPDARVVPIPGRDAAPFVGSELTTEVGNFLASPHTPAVPDRVLATVLFTDIVGSTERAAEIGDRRWRDLLSKHRNAVRRELAHYRGHEIDTAGDGFFASFDGPARAIACARRIVEAAADQQIQVRTGLHTGECERDGDKLTGLAVHIGARVAALAQPGEVLVSRTVKDLVAGSGIAFDDRGEHELKGVPGEWNLYAVTSVEPG